MIHIQCKNQQAFILAFLEIREKQMIHIQCKNQRAFILAFLEWDKFNPELKYLYYDY